MPKIPQIAGRGWKQFDAAKETSTTQIWCTLRTRRTSVSLTLPWVRPGQKEGLAMLVQLPSTTVILCAAVAATTLFASWRRSDATVSSAGAAMSCAKSACWRHGLLCANDACHHTAVLQSWLPMDQVYMQESQTMPKTLYDMRRNPRQFFYVMLSLNFVYYHYRVSVICFFF
jgi:hypothetical protein